MVQRSVQSPKNLGISLSILFVLGPLSLLFPQHLILSQCQAPMHAAAPATPGTDGGKVMMSTRRPVPPSMADPKGGREARGPAALCHSVTQQPLSTASPAATGVCGGEGRVS